MVGWAFLAPLLLLNLVVVAGPSVATVYYSFTDWSGLGPATFIGLDNYIKAFGDAKVHEALLHNLIWFVLFLSVPMAMGLLGAYLLSQVKRFQMLFRALYFIPYVVASVVNAAVWKMLLSPTSGIGHLLGIDQSWLGDPATSLLSVNFVVDWHWWGFLAVIFLAAMQGVDPSLYDAAKVDGASNWQQFASHAARHPADDGVHRADDGDLVAQGVRLHLHHDPGRPGRVQRSGLHADVQAGLQRVLGRLRGRARPVDDPGDRRDPRRLPVGCAARDGRTLTTTGRGPASKPGPAVDQAAPAGCEPVPPTWS